jgi:hypothetical protein
MQENGEILSRLFESPLAGVVILAAASLLAYGETGCNDA